jgi:endonuclease YncB( thermonuclease family)
MSLFKFKNPFHYITKKIFSPNQEIIREELEEIKDKKENQELKNPDNIKEPDEPKSIQITKIKEIEIKTPHIIKWEETIPFTIQISEGQVIKVYDGDSITIAGHYPMYNSPLFRFSVRLNGIDTAEIKGKTEEEITVAKEAKEALKNLILHKVVTLRNIGSEKYGRILADIYLDDLCINDWLIKERYAVKYDGGTKRPPKSWLKYRLTGEKD